MHHHHHTANHWKMQKETEWGRAREDRSRGDQEVEKTVKHLHGLSRHSHFWPSREQDPVNIKHFGVSLLATVVKYMLRSLY